MIALESDRLADRSTLKIGLRTVSHRSGMVGEVVIENRANVTAEIEIGIHPLQYLDLRVCDSQGEAVSEGWYGDRYSPSGETGPLRLLPGESFAHPVNLFWSVPPARRLPGQYTIRAIYEYLGLRAESEPLTITI